MHTLLILILDLCHDTLYVYSPECAHNIIPTTFTLKAH